MNCSCSLCNPSMMRCTFRYQQFTTRMKDMFLSVKNLYIFTRYTKNILIKFMYVFLGFSIRKICPETNLTSISSLIILPVYIRSILLTTINVISFVLHKFRKIDHTLYPPPHNILKDKGIQLNNCQEYIANEVGNFEI